MRVLLSYPGHAFSTLDVATGLGNGLRERHSVDVYDYNNRLAFYDVALAAWEAKSSYRRNGGDVQALAGEALSIQAIDFVPDAIVVVSGLALHPRAYDLVARLGIPLYLVLTECPYIDDEQLNLTKRSHARGVLVNDRVSLERDWGVPACYLPHSYDPFRHYPRTVSEEYQSDVYFFGTMWPEREEMMRPLMEQQNGWRVNINGARFGQGQMAHLPNEELIQGYCGTKIAINHHRTVARVMDDQVQHVSGGWSLGPRAYEIAAAGAFQLCDDTRGELEEVFGGSVPTYHDSDDLLSKVEYYLVHERERQECAAEAHERVRSCSFVRRVDEILVPFMEVTNGSTVTR